MAESYLLANPLRLGFRIQTAKASNPCADTSALKAQIDALVYRLYGLMAAEIATMKGEK